MTGWAHNTRSTWFTPDVCTKCQINPADRGTECDECHDAARSCRKVRRVQHILNARVGQVAHRGDGTSTYALEDLLDDQSDVFTAESTSGISPR